MKVRLSQKPFTQSFRRPGAVAMSIMVSTVSATLWAQAAAQSPTPAWQAAAGGKQTFEVASVRQNKSGSQQSSINVPIGPGDDSPPAGSLYSGTNVPLISYIYFAYKLTGSQLKLLMPRLPGWVIADHFDIQARAEGTPTKDQMRLMMQSLLADRFKLAMHYETQQLPVFALVVAKSGKLGPHLRPHPDDASCSAPVPQSAQPGVVTTTIDGGFPTVCHGIVGMPFANGHMRVGARDVPLRELANSLAQILNLDPPVQDQTGLAGGYDFALEWAPAFKGPASGAQESDGPLPAEPSMESRFTALEEQLGLTLKPQKGPVEIFVIDHVERPSEN